MNIFRESLIVVTQQTVEANDKAGMPQHEFDNGYIVSF